MAASKAERLAEFYGRLASAPAASDGAAAIRLVSDVLNAVEDELSGEPFDPARWMVQDRTYPPQGDNAHPDPNRPGVIRHRTRGHNVYAAPNGAIEIRNLAGVVKFRKPGADGVGL